MAGRELATFITLITREQRATIYNFYNVQKADRADPNFQEFCAWRDKRSGKVGWALINLKLSLGQCHVIAHLSPVNLDHHKLQLIFPGP